jgi:hypothetical protein
LKFLCNAVHKLVLYQQLTPRMSELLKEQSQANILSGLVQWGVTLSLKCY